MAKKNFYAVRVGKTPGIYKTWPECQSNVSGFPGAVYKGFETLPEAEAFMANGVSATNTEDNVGVENLPEVYAFTDGSFNVNTGVYGFGGFSMSKKAQTK